MKTFTSKLVTSFFVTMLFLSYANGQEHIHTHDHAPGHCPACENFKENEVNNPSTFEGEVIEWTVPSKEEQTTKIVFIILATAGVIASLALAAYRYKKSAEIGNE